MRILVVEDDRKVASFIQRGLEEEGYAVDVLHDGNDAGDQAHQIGYDCVVLDLMLPGRSGFQVLRDIRARKADLPVLILTAKDSPEERVTGLDSGADDYMGKPFALAELSARIRALLRRGTPRETKLRIADLEIDTVRRAVSRGGRAIDLRAERVRVARVSGAEQRPSDHALDHHRARLGHSLRQRQQRRRSSRQFAPKQDRSRHGCAADSYHPRRRLHAVRQADVKPLTLRTTLSLIYAAIMALLLSGLGLGYYRLLARQLELDAATELDEVTSGLRGYLRFDGGLPSLVYDRNDPEEVAFIEKATRYYQIYDANSGRLLVQSPALEPLGLHYVPAEVQAFRQGPRVHEMRTDQGRLHISSSVVAPAPGEAYLLQVGVSLDRADMALERFERLLLWSVPLGLLAVVIAGRWMVGRALAPLVRLAEATRTISVTNLQQRLPVRGAGDELDEVSLAFNDLLARQEQAIGEMRQFSAALAHELRTPLAVLRGETELALRHPGTLEEQRRHLTSQLEEFDKLSRLIGQLLTLARAEAGEIQIARTRVDLTRCAASIVEQLEPVAEARQYCARPASHRTRSWSSATRVGLNGCCSSCSTTPSSSLRTRAACR